MSALDFCTVTASTQRSPEAVAGRVGEMETHLASVSIMALMPVGADIAETVGLNSPREAKETYCPAVDILEGDRLVVGGVEYVVRWVGEWPWPEVTENFLRVVVEEIK